MTWWDGSARNPSGYDPNGYDPNNEGIMGWSNRRGANQEPQQWYHGMTLPTQAADACGIQRTNFISKDPHTNVIDVGRIAIMDGMTVHTGLCGLRLAQMENGRKEPNVTATTSEQWKR